VAAPLFVIVLLVLANGLFALSEIAVVSARKSRLQDRADRGDAGARRALRLAENPGRFLATVQVGITLIGVMAGAFGGATLSQELSRALARTPLLAPYAEPLAFGAVVLGITYLSLILGELVPKQIGLSNPERVAAAVALPMNVLSRVASPLVWVLTASTDAIVRFLPIRRSDEAPVTEAEISVLLDQGTRAGVFHETEQELVESVFWLGDRRADELMTPRRQMVWLDLADSAEETRERMLTTNHARYPVCEGSPDAVRGMVEVKDLWAAALRNEPLQLDAHIKQPLMVPESTRALRLLELFRETGVHLALVVDEYGGVAGMMTQGDLLEELSGSMGPDNPEMVQREDGSWLVDASMSVDDFREEMGMVERRDEERAEYRTVGGLVVTKLGRFPAVGEHVEVEGLRIEVVDMDGYRVDKVLVTRVVAEE
jgi:putative hemolysin